MTAPSLFATLLLASFALGACSGGKTDLPRKKTTGEIGRKYESDTRQTIFGEGGLNIGGGAKDKPGANPGNTGGGIGVNSFLWRATLDTIAFLPVTSADPFGGVILTDWYSPPETPAERFKLNVYVLGQELRADGIRVSVFRQVQDATSQWRDAPVDPETARQMEDTILTRARQLRNETRLLQN